MSPEVKKRIIIFGLSVVAAVAFLAPNFSKETFKDGWISKPLNLGLDLMGGVHLVYEVKTKEAVKSRLQSIANTVKAELRKEKVAILRTKVSDDLKLELTLVSSRQLESLKTKVSEDFKDLLMLGVADEADRPRVTYAFSEMNVQKVEEEAVNQAIETLRNRVDQFGVSEPTIQRAGVNRVILQMPGVQDIDSVKRVVGSVAKLEFRLLPAGAAPTITLKDKKGVPVIVEDEILMTGDAVKDARVSTYNGQVEVGLSLSSDGASLFRQITGSNVGRNLSIILDGTVYSSPRINEAIPGGNASISGGFTFQEAHELAVVLRAGALPAPLVALEERTVGPTLGAESIQKGIMAILMGAAFLLVFMSIYYKKAGVVAIVTLVLNLFFMLALLSAFGATLTLPGLAGLALTIGMAVDSNVLVFERIKEELRNGSTRDAAVEAGYDKAMSAIIDANITTLLTGVLLYYFGTGPIRGFAVTLSVGILTTIYCAAYVGRLMFEVLPLRSKGKEISI
jgi:preprotein translocase subunit SecD